MLSGVSIAARPVVLQVDPVRDAAQFEVRLPRERLRLDEVRAAVNGSSHPANQFRSANGGEIQMISITRPPSSPSPERCET